MLLAGAALALGACNRSPSPEELQRTLVQHPEIVYAVIKAHPAQFLEVVQGAVQVAQDSLRTHAATADSARLEEDLRHPKQPAIAGRAGFGNPNAPVTIVEYTDFECPYCQRERDVLVELLKSYGPRVRLVVKQLPLDIHPHALAAARMWEAVARQDPRKAYKLYDVLYSAQDRLKSDGDAFLKEAVAAVGADVPRAEADAQSDSVRRTVEADIAEARRFGFTGTPGFLVNGVFLEGAHPAADFHQVIDRLLAAGPASAAPSAGPAASAAPTSNP